jgi:hypothetical protein
MAYAALNNVARVKEERVSRKKINPCERVEKMRSTVFFPIGAVRVWSYLAE